MSYPCENSLTSYWVKIGVNELIVSIHKTHILTCDDIRGRSHQLLTQSTEHDTLCPKLDVVHLEASLHQDDMLFLVNNTEGHHHINVECSNSTSTSALSYTWSNTHYPSLRNSSSWK